MGDLVSIAEARDTRHRRKQAEIFSHAPILALQAAYIEMIWASFYAGMAICFSRAGK
jgi:hypothetical protein